MSAPADSPVRTRRNRQVGRIRLAWHQGTSKSRRFDWISITGTFRRSSLQRGSPTGRADSKYTPNPMGRSSFVRRHRNPSESGVSNECPDPGQPIPLLPAGEITGQRGGPEVISVTDGSYMLRRI